MQLKYVCYYLPVNQIYNLNEHNVYIVYLYTYKHMLIIFIYLNGMLIIRIPIILYRYIITNIFLSNIDKIVQIFLFLADNTRSYLRIIER